MEMTEVIEIVWGILVMLLYVKIFLRGNYLNDYLTNRPSSVDWSEHRTNHNKRKCRKCGNVGCQPSTFTGQGCPMIRFTENGDCLGCGSYDTVSI
jgi:hypothetical protein